MLKNYETGSDNAHYRIPLAIFPLDRVGARFQILRLFPGYRTHVSPGDGIALVPSPLLVSKSAHGRAERLSR